MTVSIKAEYEIDDWTAEWERQNFTSGRDEEVRIYIDPKGVFIPQEVFDRINIINEEMESILVLGMEFDKLPHLIELATLLVHIVMQVSHQHGEKISKMMDHIKT